MPESTLPVLLFLKKKSSMHFCFYFCSDEILNLANFLKIKSHWNFIYISEINIKIIPSPHSQNSVLEIKGIYMLSFLKFFYNYS